MTLEKKNKGEDTELYKNSITGISKHTLREGVLSLISTKPSTMPGIQQMLSKCLPNKLMSEQVLCPGISSSLEEWRGRGAQ